QGVENSIGLVTALGPALGYEACSHVAKRALAEKRRVADIVLEEGLLDAGQIDRLLQLEAMTRPSRPARYSALAGAAAAGTTPDRPLGDAAPE
ncbi:MAG: hypothetical protein ACRYGC_10685, partial [Janthinobacterium lividum]